MNVQTPTSGARVSGAATGPAVTQVTLKNPGKHGLTVALRLIGGRGRFALGSQRPTLTLTPNGILRLPVRFRPGPAGHVFTAATRHRTALQVIDAKTGRVLQTLPISAAGPGWAPAEVTHCYYSPTSSGDRPARVRRDPAADPPPAIERTSYRTGTHLWANTGTMDTWWRIDNIEAAGDWVEVGSFEPGWGDGIPDAGGWATHYAFPEAADHCEAEATWTADRTVGSHLAAGNADGRTEDTEWYYSRRRVGYGHAAVPNDPMVSAADVAHVCDWLESVDRWLRADGLRDFTRYTEYWNTNVLADPEFPDDIVFNGGLPADDADYMCARVGTGGLADDMLDAMDSVLVYTRAGHLPRTWRPDSHFDPDNIRLCDPAYGITLGSTTRAPGTYADWLALCLDIADDMTLAHELFHYAAQQHFTSEDRAYLLSYLYTSDTYGWKPSPDWPDWD